MAVLEISNLVVEWDARTGERVPVRTAEVVARLRTAGDRRAARIVQVDELEFDASRHVPRVRAASWRGAQTGDDGDFAETLAEWARTTLSTTIEIVRQPTDQKGFSAIAAQVAAEWKLACLIGYRWLARDYERHLATSEAFIRWASPYRSSCSGRSCGATQLQPCYLKISNTF